jgi:hypothetical protein
MKNGYQATHPGRKPFALSPSTIRSKVANGSALLDGIDARSAPARRFKDLQQSMTSDLGGTSVMTEGQLQLIRTAAGLVCMREHLDAAMLRGESIDVSLYCTISNTLKRVLQALGLKRMAKPVMSPLEYSRHLEAERATP